MTGGQGNDGQLSALRIVNELLAIGIENTVLVYDDKEDLSLSSFPSQIEKLIEPSSIMFKKNYLKSKV